jgi:hypothetical protein
MVSEGDMEEASSSSIRKITDAHQEKIDSLIAEEPDSKARLTLMVMSSINKSIAANTELTYAVHREVKALKTELETHITDGEAIKNKGVGVYQVMRILVPALWVVAFTILGNLYSNYNKFQDKVDADTQRMQMKIVDVDTRLSIHLGQVEDPNQLKKKDINVYQSR